MVLFWLYKFFPTPFPAVSWLGKIKFFNLEEFWNLQVGGYVTFSWCFTSFKLLNFVFIHSQGFCISKKKYYLIHHSFARDSSWVTTLWFSVTAGLNSKKTQHLVIVKVVLRNHLQSEKPFLCSLDSVVYLERWWLFCKSLKQFNTSSLTSYFKRKYINVCNQIKTLKPFRGDFTDHWRS